MLFTPECGLSWWVFHVSLRRTWVVPFWMKSSVDQLGQIDCAIQFSSILPDFLLAWFAHKWKRVLKSSIDTVDFVVACACRIAMCSCIGLSYHYVMYVLCSWSFSFLFCQYFVWYWYNHSCCLSVRVDMVYLLCSFTFNLLVSSYLK